MNKLKKFLQIVLYIFIILTCIRSCSKAWSWEDFVEFCGEVQPIVDTNYRNGINYLVNHLSYVESGLLQQNIDVDDFDTFLIDSGGSQACQITFIDSSNTSWKFADSYLRFDSNVNYTLFYVTTTDTFSSSSGSKTYFKNYSVVGLVDTNPTDNNFRSAIIQNYFNYFKLRSPSITQNIVVPQVIADARIGIKYVNQYTDLDFKLFNVNGDYMVDLTDTTTSTNGGNFSQLTLNVITPDMVNGDTYYVDFYGDDTQFYRSSNFVITWVDSGGGSGSSGDSSSSGDINVDLSNIESKLDSINSNIESLPFKFYNDSGEKGIVQKIYDDLFTLDSGDVTEIISCIDDQLSSGDTPFLYLKAFLDPLTKEPNDFIISWEDIPISLTFNGGSPLVSGDFIEANEINFSKLARENDQLTLVKFWINLVLTLTVYILMSFNTYRLLLKTIGVSTDYVDSLSSDDDEVITESISDSYSIHDSGKITHNPVTIRQTIRRRK